MKLIVDAQLPPSLAEWLRRNGNDASHVQDLGLRNAKDFEIREFAAQMSAVVITKDRDFVPLDGGVPVISIRTGNISNRVLIERVQSACPSVRAYLADGVQVIEIR